jgi:glycerophosphoryl diester phosphodiesterase|tara:strand:- start:41 stop:742 length:702 start_codon:yes stop_codon:yes gene_type:complete
VTFERAPVVIGHRGAAGLVAENTLPSFRRAFACGVGAVELDVYALAGQLVVIHDETLDRTTDGTGTVMGQTLESLRALDAGGGWPVPYLEEVVAELPAGVGLNVELKGPGTAAPVADFVARFPDVDWLISSFDHAALADFRARDTASRVAPLFSRWRGDPWRTAAALSAWAVNLSVRAAAPEHLRAARERGLRTFVYTVNDLDTARRLIDEGATGVFTDYPDRITAAALGGPG